MQVLSIEEVRLDVLGSKTHRPDLLFYHSKLLAFHNYFRGSKSVERIAYHEGDSIPCETVCQQLGQLAVPIRDVSSFLLLVAQRGNAVACWESSTRHLSTGNTHGHIIMSLDSLAICRYPDS